MEKNRVLRAKLGGRRLCLTDTERRRLAALAHPLGRKRLKEIVVIATPDTLLAFVVLFALCDASAPTNWAVVGEYFGRQTFSRLQDYIQLVNFPGALGAPVFLGWWYDHHHTYAFPLLLSCS